MVSAWRRLCGLEAFQVSEIPRWDEDGRDRDPGRAQRTAALVAAYHGGEALAFGWLRERAGDPVRVLGAGPGLVGRAGRDEVVLALPGGGRGRVLGQGAAAAAMAGLACWRAIGGISDGLAAGLGGGDGDRDRTGPSLQECLLPTWGGPFGWIVVAEPVAALELQGLADDEARRERLARRLGDRFPEQDVQARRHRDRHTELRQGLSTGLWRVHLLAGGTDPAAAARVAGLVCASADLRGLPYSLTPTPAEASGFRALLDPGPAASLADLADLDEDVAPRAPFHASTALLAALARVPDREIPGIRLALRPDFDVTPEQSPGASVALGEVLDRQRLAAGPLRIPLESLNRHVFVCGATGGGKSQTVRGLLEAASQAGVPWLVVEPAKAEYRLMATRLAGSGAAVVRIRPGEADAVAAGLNPLEPATDGHGRRFPLQTHADLVRALFLAAFQSEEPFPQVLSAALTRVYEEAGWDLALGEPRRPDLQPGYPGLADLQRTAEQVVRGIGYGPEMSADVLGFIKVRLASLRLGTTGRFLDGGHPIDFARLLRANVVLEIEDVGDDRDKAFLMGTVLLRLVEHLRLMGPMGCKGAEGCGCEEGGEGREWEGRGGEELATEPGGKPGPGLRHLTVFEEAHRLLRRPEPGAGAAAHAVELFAGLLAEVRAYGEGIIIVEQIPARLISDAIKNTAVKVVHRLPAADDREAVGATMNLSPAQSRYLVTLAPGEAAVSADGMDHPVLARMPDGTAREAEESGQPYPAASPATVVSVRSVTCGADCVASPCTLRDLRAAQRAAESDPAITLWAELSVLAHLTGWPMPIPQPPLLKRLAGWAARRRDCALSQAVDAAVAARTPLIAGRVGAPALASHVVTAMRARVTQGTWLCPEQEPQWLAPAPRRPAGTVPDWEEDRQPADLALLHPLAFGLTGPSAVERAIGTCVTDADFEAQLAGYLEREFTDCKWPLRYLKRRK
ncbi:MAG: ATP-binding protein [Actinobacteria bacterium]|nr:ATP-binding protein [Actinomycetota bacterium]